MNWIVNISKNAVTLINQNNEKVSAADIRPGWTATVDKIDEFVLVKLVNSENKAIHLYMLPADCTSIIWTNIYDIYRQYETNLNKKD